MVAGTHTCLYPLALPGLYMEPVTGFHTASLWVKWHPRQVWRKKRYLVAPGYFIGQDNPDLYYNTGCAKQAKSKTGQRFRLIIQTFSCTGLFHFRPQPVDPILDAERKSDRVAGPVCSGRFAACSCRQ